MKKERKIRNEALKDRLEKELFHRYTNETAVSYSYSIQRFMNLHPNPVRLKLRDIERYFADLKRMGKSIAYRKTQLASVKVLFDLLLDFGLMKEHPCKSYLIDEKKPTGKDFGSLLTMNEMEVLLNLKEERFKHVGNRNKSIIGILIYQGITSKELVHLNVQHIDLDSGTIQIKGQGKNKSRTLELKPSQITTLMRYINEDRPMLLKSKTNKLFIGMRGVPMTTEGLHEFISRLSGAFDKNLCPMTIRNSVISYWLNDRKMPLEDVQIMAGHSYPSTTEQYINPNTQEQREAVSRLHKSIFE